MKNKNPQFFLLPYYVTSNNWQLYSTHLLILNKNKLNIISYSDYINYLIDKHDDKIKELLNKIMDKDNYTKYKYIGLYILNKKTEFIIDNVKKLY